MFGRATIRLGIGPHSSYYCIHAHRPLCLLLDSKSSIVVVGWKAKCRLSKCTQSRFARLLIVHYSIL